ncbi:helix-turn-helix domain-containing protein [Paenibacillus sp. SYP-B4298]|uniref:helix-turn-helix domain-containing protein n=1 Tax=Paenibacillus sp. SYP-B4298 TaxID=2996034 RepID=UPI0022DDCCB8|nr:helix-turn-helix transcriptional regulator [Paenibacillus sp. SYP-B4298]
MSTLNERIKERRLALNLTLLDVSEYLGVKEATAQRYESGEIKNIKHETIVSLAELFKCSPAYLMGWTNEVLPLAEQSPLSKSEINMFRKFKALDDLGKHTVSTVLDMEYNRVNKPHLEVIAAHNNDYSEEQQELMKRDLDKLDKL